MNAAARLRRQDRSRSDLRKAAARYVALRAGTGTHTETVRAELRDGTPVEVIVDLAILPTTAPERPRP